MKIIVNADDLGISHEVNEEIFHGMRSGRITSATALSNSPAIDAAAKDSRFFPQCSFGAHLNLSEFRPLSNGKSCGLESILNDSRCFDGNAVREISLNAPLLFAIYREWCAQIEHLMRLGFKISHLDSHHHVHTLPELLPVVTAISRRYKIGKIRISRNLYGTEEHPSSLLMGKKRIFNLTLRALGFKTTDRFTDLQTFIRSHSESVLSSGSIELMTHPGSFHARHENELLEGDWRSILSYQYRLISYHEL